MIFRLTVANTAEKGRDRENTVTRAVGEGTEAHLHMAEAC
jgi:hypothetical protein